MFELHQPICIVDDEKETVVAISNLESLGRDLANLCHVHQVNHVHFLFFYLNNPFHPFGNEEYANQIIQDLKEQASLAYSNENIIIEVN